MPNSSSQLASSRYGAGSSTMSTRSRSDQRSAGSSERACEPTTSNARTSSRSSAQSATAASSSSTGVFAFASSRGVEVDRALVHAAQGQLPIRDALVQLGEHRLRVDAGQRPGAGHRMQLDQAAEQPGRHAGAVDGQDDAGVVRGRAHARPRRRTQPRAPRRRRPAPGTAGRAHRPPCRPTSTSSQTSESTSCARSASSAPRNRASAFGEPKRDDAPPSSSTPVTARRSAMARSTR